MRLSQLRPANFCCSVSTLREHRLRHSVGAQIMSLQGDMQTVGKGLGVVSLAIILLSVVCLQKPFMFVESESWVDGAFNTRDSKYYRDQGAWPAFLLDCYLSFYCVKATESS